MTPENSNVNSSPADIPTTSPIGSAESVAVVTPASPAMIRLENLTRWFGKTCAVNKVSFEVKAGEVFGFIGPNGAGKTTSMRILSTLDTPTAGDAWIDGFSVVDDSDRVRRRLGFMPDNFGTYPNVNCEEYLDFFARAYGLRGNERRKALMDVMGFTQLDRMANKPINGLSKGMKQRLCLGRTMIHNPAVLILDEPAAGLDPRARIELRDMIKDLAADGKSLLVSSHILTELAEMCDRVAIIEQGSLLAVGTVEEILSGKLNAQSTGISGSAPQSIVDDRVQIEVSVVSDFGTAKSWLEQREDIDSVAMRQGQLSFEYSSAPEQRAELLAEMIQANIRVSSFAERQLSLEDAFLRVTQGRVQ